MMTVITRVELQPDMAPEWDEAMRERMRAAESADGWLGGQILIPLESLNERLIVGTWQTRAHWEAWHTDAEFQETRQRLADLGAKTGQTTWHEVIEHKTPA